MNNLIKNIPYAIFQLKKLRNLDISCNKLESINSSIKTLALEDVDISNNPRITMLAVKHLLANKRLKKLIYSPSPRINLNELCRKESAKFQEVAQENC